MKRKLIIFVVALPFIISLVFLADTKHPASVMDEPFPNPNGYDKFVKAAGMIKGDTEHYDEMSKAELAELVATNVEALALAKSAFTNECRVSIKYADHLDTDRLDSFRRLAQTMTAVGRLAESQHNLKQAAKDYLDVVHCGMECGRGGFILDALIGVASENLGYTHLTNLVASLDAASCRNAARTLENLDSKRLNWDDAVEREVIGRRQQEHQLVRTLKGRFMLWLWTHKEDSDSLKRGKVFFFNQQKETRELALKLAARAYELDKGKPPASIANLVPAYLNDVPKDPSTGKDMVYPPR